MNKLLCIFLCFFMAIVTTACDDDEIEVFTGNATNVTNFSANVSCRVQTDLSLDGCSFGVLYSTSRGTVESGAGKEAVSHLLFGDVFEVDLAFTDLNGVFPPHTKFYYCGYVQKGMKTYYGDVKYLYTGEMSAEEKE